MKETITRSDNVVHGWEGYELLDSGDGRKLERFADMVLDRPDPQALWEKADITLWDSAHARFEWGEKEERWKILKEIPKEWVVEWSKATFRLDLKEFKHIGIFPEHANQWDEIATIGKKEPQLRMLNLFGYTGAASVVAAQAGIAVTHVDASKHAIVALKENMQHSGLAEDAIRTITEDALKYAKRLVQRGEQFEIIVMDPPAFGRGPKGEVWKIEDGLGELLALIPQLLSPSAQLVILNGYAAGFSARTFGELLYDVLKEKDGEISYGDISVQQKKSNRLLTTGIFAEWKI